jgi:OOP family OmpA-OmpF porin
MVVSKRIATLLGALAGFFLAASGAWAQSDVPSVLAPLGDAFKVPNLLAKTQSRVVFYRNSAGEKTSNLGVVTLYLDGAYLASVQQGAFTELCFKPSSIEVSARYVKNGTPPLEDVALVNSLKLQGGEETFVKVLDDGSGKPLMMVTRPEQALPELVKTRRQQHTISRVPAALVCEDRNKPELPKVVVTSAPLRRATLSADALFQFGKSDIESIPPKGRRLLDHLVDRIKSEFGAGKDVRIHIVGHADRFGSEAGNLRISKERAATIKAYFVNSGLQENSITTDGRGDKEPVVTGCGVAYTRANVACNKPNRRVDLDVRTKVTGEASN